MKTKRKQIAKDMHLVAVTDCEDRIIVSGVFTKDNADTAKALITSLLKKTGLHLIEKVNGIRCIPFAPLVDSLLEMERCGVGEPVEEIIA